MKTKPNTLLRFYSTYTMIMSAIEAKEILVKMSAPTSDLPLTDVNRSAILEISPKNFWAKLTKISEILLPIVESIKVLEMDSANISDVPHHFNLIMNAIQVIDSQGLVDISLVILSN